MWQTRERLRSRFAQRTIDAFFVSAMRGMTNALYNEIDLLDILLGKYDSDAPFGGEDTLQYDKNHAKLAFGLKGVFERCPFDVVKEDDPNRDLKCAGVASGVALPATYPSNKNKAPKLEFLNLTHQVVDPGWAPLKITIEFSLDPDFEPATGVELTPELLTQPGAPHYNDAPGPMADPLAAGYSLVWDNVERPAGYVQPAYFPNGYFEIPMPALLWAAVRSHFQTPVPGQGYVSGHVYYRYWTFLPGEIDTDGDGVRDADGWVISTIRATPDADAWVKPNRMFVLARP